MDGGGDVVHGGACLGQAFELNGNSTSTGITE